MQKYIGMKEIKAMPMNRGEYNKSHIDMKTADDKIVPWLASQTDVLATDWVLVE